MSEKKYTERELRDAQRVAAIACINCCAPSEYRSDAVKWAKAVYPAPKVTRPMTEHDPVDHPTHYTAHPSGVECIQITEHLSFCVGNAIKYLWRADLKNGLEDLEKARWYIDREIARRGLCDPDA